MPGACIPEDCTAVDTLNTSEPWVDFPTTCTHATFSLSIKVFSDPRQHSIDLFHSNLELSLFSVDPLSPKDLRCKSIVHSQQGRKHLSLLPWQRVTQCQYLPVFTRYVFRYYHTVSQSQHGASCVQPQDYCTQNSSGGIKPLVNCSVVLRDVEATDKQHPGGA